MKNFNWKSKMCDSSEKLIEEVRKHPSLYDLQSDQYKNYYYKQDLWTKIGEVVGVTADEAKKKWKIIRDSYKRFKLREQQPSGSECAFSKPYKYSEQLRFLDDVPSKRNTTSNIFEEASITSESELYTPPAKTQKIIIQERLETFLNAATTSIENITAKAQTKSTTQQMFETLANKIDEAGLSQQQVADIESTVCSIVFSKIAEYKY